MFWLQMWMVCKTPVFYFLTYVLGICLMKSSPWQKLKLAFFKTFYLYVNCIGEAKAVTAQWFCLKFIINNTKVFGLKNTYYQLERPCTSAKIYTKSRMPCYDYSSLHAFRLSHCTLVQKLSVVYVPLVDFSKTFKFGINWMLWILHSPRRLLMQTFLTSRHSTTNLF